MSGTIQAKNNWFKQLGQRGDSIVEVMLSIMVIGSVLASAFVMTNRSTAGVRDSEEHSQASQLLQGQLESLRELAKTTSYATLPSYFCFQPDGTLATLAGSSAYGCLASQFYTFNIAKGPVPAPGETTSFTVSVQWDTVTGQKGNENFYYHIGLR